MFLSADRREFLKQSLAAGAILGFPFVVEGQQARGPGAPARPAAPAVDLLALAQAHMKQEVKPGVVLVIPQAGPAQEKLANELAHLLGVGGAAACQDQPIQGKVNLPPIGAGDPAAQVLFCQAVFVCFPFEQLRRQAPELQPDTAAILLGIDGRGVAVLKSEPDLFGKDFAAKMGAFLHGPRGEHLAAVVKAQREALGAGACEEFEAAVRDLDADAFPAREAASKKLAQLAPRAPALLAAALAEAKGLEPRRRIERVFADLYAAAPQGKHGPRMPFGVAWEARQVDPCPPCGLAVVPAQARLFLRFVTGPEKK